MTLQFRRFGGPTVVFGLGGRTFMTDPTFDPPGDYPLGSRTLTKTAAAAGGPADAGPVDVVLLSHDQHPDNLDHAGRVFAASVPLVLSTPAAAARLGGPTRGLDPWAHVDLPRPGTGHLRVTAVPAQHGPDGTEHLTGPVTGFVLHGDGLPTVYVSGDNASLAVVAGIAARFPVVDVAVLFGGRARTPLLGDADLTLSADGMLEAARILGAKRVVPVHVDSWAHFTEGIDDVRAAFARADSLPLLG
ncbi:MBL fold metallo-hydrolase [Dactylosporangium aurantiacum]|uniref:MBL fold metallo-hydrolase n=1 Tax=Dactylosporangium aurantiacum TaxID=35754 RepID=A0A9Q9MLP0_9ACTN|nr:MBL fold metallo-hydrolase [Dactylosporangium aurantiacum]MDG6105522.1 MBL fold metallo-hydrolase [Dactylosporangium aurantiacum]UWZ57131.1 MBL fold metallo-hydrolase [Dactylosporangium aurantiacum]